MAATAPRQLAELTARIRMSVWLIYAIYMAKQLADNCLLNCRPIEKEGSSKVFDVIQHSKVQWVQMCKCHNFKLLGENVSP